jgi:S-adenosylmethionine hydrolase
MIATERTLLVGPDNGLFIPVVRRSDNCEIEAIEWRPERLSESFHGRDLFAPVAARLANGEEVAGSPLKPQEMVGFDSPLDGKRIIYIDHYGNAITGIKAEQVKVDQVFLIHGSALHYARTFTEVSVGQAFWYRNSMGLVELAINCGSAASLLNLKLGMPIAL